MIFTALDDGPHTPPGGSSPSWQECWSFDWQDPATAAAGAHRIRLIPAAGAAETGSWVLAGGTLSGGSQTCRLPWAGETGAVRAGRLSLRAVQPLRSYIVTAGPGTEVSYTAAADAFRFSMSGQRADPGGDHYESFGIVTGTVHAGGRPVEVTGPGFYRHSWGVPRPDTRPVQSAHGTFGDDLFFSVTEYCTPEGRVPLGYLVEDGEFHGVEKARFRTEIDGSGLPRRCDLLIATADRRDFRIPGAVTSAAPGGPAFATFDLGRRRGTGLLELHGQG
jgi:hypothetical protein